MTSALFDIIINNDSILETNEAFQLTIISSSLPNRVSQSDYNQTYINILDDESKGCVFISTLCCMSLINTMG